MIQWVAELKGKVVCVFSQVGDTFLLNNLIWERILADDWVAMRLYGNGAFPAKKASYRDLGSTCMFVF